jgi:membrane fusion protein (multidrug efflux system)
MKKTTTSNVSAANRAYLFIAVSIIATTLVYFCIHIVENLNAIHTNDAQVDAYITPISARAGGFIKKVCFEEHQQVKIGDTLVILEDQEYQQKLNEAYAFVEDAKAQLDVLDAGIHSAETGTLVNRDQIEAAKARLLQQQSDIKRYRNLIKEEAVTGADLESVQARHDVALSDFHAAQSGLKTGLARVDELKSRRALLKAELKKKNAQLALAKINVTYTIVRAPYTGRMGRKTILEGQQIQSGQPLVFIVNDHKKWITANFKETQIEDLHIGQVVNIEVDAISKRTYKGRIQAISASTGSKFSLLPPDNSTGNFVKIIQRVPVRISFDDQNIEEVKSGMNATVSVYHN